MNDSKILLVGEPMGLLIAKQAGELSDVPEFSSYVCGAEYNVAVGLTRLGISCSYMTRLGRDPFGDKIYAALKENNIDFSDTIRDDKRLTGFMLKGKTEIGDPKVFYYRKNSAASAISADDIDKIDLEKYSHLHITGILPALSSQALNSTFHLIKKAKSLNKTIFFDPNLRPSLWENSEYMVKTINEIASYCDYIFPGINEGKILCGSDNPKEIADFYLINSSVKTVIIKVGAKGAYVKTKKDATKTFEEFWSAGFPVSKVIDTVGAGDGFAVGVISGIIEKMTLKEAVSRGNAIGALQVMSVSDNEGLPTRDELINFMNIALP